MMFAIPNLPLALGTDQAMSFIDRRQFITLLSGLAILPMFAACKAPSQPISVAAHTWPGYEPIFMARNEGWLDPGKVSLIETSSATESLQALADGKVHGAALTLDEVIRARAIGIPLTAVLVFDISAGADMLLARPDIKDIHQLKGKRIGVENGGVGALMFRQALQFAAIDPASVEQVSLTIDQQYDAWQKNALDAVITYEPVSSRLINLGANKLFDSRMIPDTIVDVLALRTEVIDEPHAEAIRHFLASHIKALNHLNSNPQDAIYRIAPHLNLPPDQVLTTFRGLVLPNLENNIRLLSGKEPKLLTGARKVSKLIAESGLTMKEDSLQNLINGNFLAQENA